MRESGEARQAARSAASVQLVTQQPAALLFTWCSCSSWQSCAGERICLCRGLMRCHDHRDRNRDRNMLGERMISLSSFPLCPLASRHLTWAHISRTAPSHPPTCVQRQVCARCELHVRVLHS